MKQFDYIIAGGGCSGLSLAVRLLPYLKKSGKKVLLVEKIPEKGNDKTWCFWEQFPDVFEPVVFRKWDHMSFSSSFIKQKLYIAPYQYKMIRAADFYAYTNKKLSQSNHITSLSGNVTRLYTENEKAYAVIDGETFSADYVFSSIPRPQKKMPGRYQYLLQHFEGWVIDTKDATFDPKSATLMDFNTAQDAGTSFVYVLPFSPNRALVEYTVFSENLLSADQYTASLEKYIGEQLHCKDYQIIEIERGVIPMSDHPISTHDHRVIYLGTAGGFTKGSTGYTFRFIQKHTAAIVAELLKSGSPRIPSISASRFGIYDATLLHLLSGKKLSGEKIFSTMFKKNDPKKILKFLDNETSITEEINIFRTLQKRAFSLALLQRSLKLISTFKVTF